MYGDEEQDLDDGEERDSHGRTLEDYLADEADRKRKILKEYEADPVREAEAERRLAEALYERDKRLFGPQEALDA